MQTDTPPAPPAVRKYGPVTVADLTVGQVERFYREGYILEDLPALFEAFKFGRDRLMPGAITGVLPWCNLYGLIEPNGDVNT